MPDFTEDEIMLIRIYYESKKDWLIGNLMTMLLETTAEEAELRNLSEGLIRKLAAMENSQYQELCRQGYIC